MENAHTPLERGLTVLLAFSENEPTLSVSELSRKTGIPYSAVYRCIYTLSKLGIVKRERKSCFSLSPAALDLCSSYAKPLESLRPPGKPKSAVHPLGQRGASSHG